MSRSLRPVAVVVVGLLLLSACPFGDFAFAFVVVSIIPFAFGFWLLISRSLPWYGCCLPWAAAADTFANIDYATDTPASASLPSSALSPTRWCLLAKLPCTFSHFPALSLYLFPSNPLLVCKQRWSLLDSAFLPLISDNFLVVDIAAAHMRHAHHRTNFFAADFLYCLCCLYQCMCVCALKLAANHSSSFRQSQLGQVAVASCRVAAGRCKDALLNFDGKPINWKN